MHHHPALRVSIGVCFQIFLHPHRVLLQSDIGLVQFGHAVGQLDGVLQPIRLLFGPCQQPPKDAVGGGLGGQTKEDSALAAVLG